MYVYSCSVAELHPTLLWLPCPMDCSPPGSSVHRIPQARILEWVAILFFRGSSRSRNRTHVSCSAGMFFTTEPPGKPMTNYEWVSDSYLLSHVQLFATLWTVAHQAHLSMEFFTQEYWSGLPFFSPGNLLNPGIKSGSPALQAYSLPSEPAGKPWLTIPYFKLGWL